MPASSHRGEPDIDPAMAAALIGGFAVVLALLFLAIEWPVFVWSLVVHGDLMLMDPATAIGGGLRVVFSRSFEVPQAWASFSEVLPPTAAWVALDVTGVVMLLVLAAAAWLRFDAPSERSTLGMSWWDPRKKAKQHAWAVPRYWLHLQPREGSRSGVVRRGSNVVLRVLMGKHKAPEPVGGDGWNLGRLRGAEVRSTPEKHQLVVAPTRAGKTRRVLAVEAIEHDGAAVIISNKLDVVQITRAARERRGPVWVYAPLTDSAGKCVGWTPLTGCAKRDRALEMAQWIFDADPTAAAASEGSGGARFYNREAVEVLMPALLQAAALGDHRMADVLGWLRGGVDALDHPRKILEENDDPKTIAWASAEALAGVQMLDERARSLLLMSAAQLVGAYRLSGVQEADRQEFNPFELLAKRGTLYLIVPEGQMDALAPILGGILGDVLRACELRSHRVEDPRQLGTVKILADEAAHLASLGKLPTYLSVSAGWGVRWCLIFQSIAQVQHRYGAEAGAVMANTMVKKIMGPIHDKATRDEIVALLGQEQIEQTSHTSDPLGGARSTTRHEQSRAVVSAEQLARLGVGEAIVVHDRNVPAIVRLPFYDEWKEPRRR